MKTSKSHSTLFHVGSMYEILLMYKSSVTHQRQVIGLCHHTNVVGVPTYLHRVANNLHTYLNFRVINAVVRLLSPCTVPIGTHRRLFVHKYGMHVSYEREYQYRAQ